jgi:hypothetical protein
MQEVISRTLGRCDRIIGGNVRGVNGAELCIRHRTVLDSSFRLLVLFSDRRTGLFSVADALDELRKGGLHGRIVVEDPTICGIAHMLLPFFPQTVKLN